MTLPLEQCTDIRIAIGVLFFSQEQVDEAIDFQIQGFKLKFCKRGYGVWIEEILANVKTVIFALRWMYLLRNSNLSVISPQKQENPYFENPKMEIIFAQEGHGVSIGKILT